MDNGYKGSFFVLMFKMIKEMETNKEKVLTIAVITIVVSLIVGSLVSPFFVIRSHGNVMSDLYKNSNLPMEYIGLGASREFSEQDGGHFRDTNLVEIDEMVWAIVTHHRPRQVSNFNRISGFIWFGDTHDTSFNEEFHVFGFRAGRQWSGSIIDFFTEKDFIMSTASRDGDSYYGFHTKNGSYNIRFRVNSDNYIIEIGVSTSPL
ncbi:MAG: hypothetical protein FWE27_07855 [Defluviitaleaceae bacterium]|nr:hypothetical protein [Defluviitaleaceae bacterium]